MQNILKITLPLKKKADLKLSKIVTLAILTSSKLPDLVAVKIFCCVLHLQDPHHYSDKTLLALCGLCQYPYPFRTYELTITTY